MSVTFSLDDPCGRVFTYRDLIQCGSTWGDLARSGTPIDNLPHERDTLKALEALCLEVLDPISEAFGRPHLTYGFASASLCTRIKSRIAPRLDQHAAHECRGDGQLICPRLGAAVDLVVPGTTASDLGRWIFANTRFDRLYLYGDARPLHVSYGPGHARSVVELVEGVTGRRTPKKLRWSTPEGMP